MPKKKDNKSAESSAEEALNKRVDAIMDPKLPDPAPIVSGKAEVPPIDIFKDAPPAVADATKTAPEVPGELLKNVDTEAIEKQMALPPPPKKQKPVLMPVKQEKQVKLTPAQVKPASSRPVPSAKLTKSTDLDDQVTERAVDDIAAKEADTMLALQDAIGRKATRVAGELAEGDKRAIRRKTWLWLIILVVAVALFLLAVPHISYTCHWPIGIRLRVTTDILPSVCK